jgi:S1-C subfamily serine protease
MRVHTGLRTGLPIVACLLIAGCVSHNFVPGPGMSVAELQPDMARCRLFARGADPGSSFGAAGSPRFVATAMVVGAIGSAIASGVRQSADYDDCMIARGWLVSNTAPKVVQEAPTVGSAPSERIDAAASVSGPRVLPIMAQPVRRSFGVRAGNMDDALAYSLQLNPLRAGVLVLEVERRGAGREGGLRPGDVLLSFNEQALFTVADLKRELGHVEPGSIVLAQVWRGGEKAAVQFQF